MRSSRATSQSGRNSAINVRPMAYPDGSNSKVALPLARERFDITRTGFPVFVQRVEDSNSHFSVDGTQLCPRGLRPSELHRRPNSRRISSCEITFPARTSSVARAIAAASPSVTGSSSDPADKAALYAGLTARYSKNPLPDFQGVIRHTIEQESAASSAAHP